MQFNSYSYLMFLLVGVLVFWTIPQRGRRMLVLALSLLFYALWNPWFLLVPFVIAASTYVCGRMISERPDRSRFWMTAGIAVVLAVLGFFKYRGFVVDNLSALLAALGDSWSRPGLVTLVLPLGISFYSFEAISWLIDVRQKRLTRISFVDLLLFIMFWPHLLAGPIVRARELIPQLQFTKSFEAAFVVRGLDRIIWGLVQKNLFANNIAGWVDAGFMPVVAKMNSTVDNWVLGIAFGLQIYFDFCAYSSIAIGSAQLVGITLPENFRFPYHAANPAEFWSRWHMTLSRWVRDYLFFPMNAKFGGSPARLYPSLVIIMALVGLWHGAGWCFILWGVMHGLYLVVFRMYESFEEQKKGPEWLFRAARLAWRPLTLAAVIAAWVVFRSPNAAQALTMLKTMFFGFRFGLSQPVNAYLVIMLLMLEVAAEPYLAKWIDRFDGWATERAVWAAGNLYVLRPFAYAFGVLLFMIFDDRDTQFIYFQF